MKKPNLARLLVAIFISLEWSCFSEKRMAEPNSPKEIESCTIVPTNDDCANAIMLTVGAGSIFGNTCMTSIASGEPLGCVAISGLAPDQSVWFKFIATQQSLMIGINQNPPAGNPCSINCCPISAVIWHSPSGCPTSECEMLNCQSAWNGPDPIKFNFDSLIIGDMYYIQIPNTTYGGVCGSDASFAIWVSKNLDSGVSNPVYQSTYSAPQGTAYCFDHAPTTAEVLDSCAKYANPATIMDTNKVMNFCVNIKTNNSNAIHLGIILQSTCPITDNVVWLTWEVRTTAGVLVACGDLSDMEITGLECDTIYVACLHDEIPACLEYYYWPYAWSAGGSCSGLPIELLDFHAEYLEIYKKAELDWSTASETNNDYFIIERSANGKDFDYLETVSGRGTTHREESYVAYDEHPFSPVSYYRLKQVDFDGRFSYSKTEHVLVPYVYEFYQNGAGFRFSTRVEGSITIVDLLGQEVLMENIPAGAVAEKPEISSGLYIFSFAPHGGDEYYKSFFMKVK